MCANHLNNLKKVVKFVSLDFLKIRLDKKFSAQFPEQYFYDRTWQVKLNTCLNSGEMIEVRGDFHVVAYRNKTLQDMFSTKAYLESFMYSCTGDRVTNVPFLFFN